jgi:acetylglutamate/LysW-gamma-L-alpha-aminoadipate kinase
VDAARKRLPGGALILILKVGGGRDINIEGIAADLSTIRDRVIVVHGANAFRDELAVQLHREKTVVTSVSGYSSVLSDDSAIELQMMAYAGLRNKQIVEACQRKGVNAVGLSGLDGRAIQGRRNRGIRVQDGEKVRMLRDRSGKPDAANAAFLNLLVSNGYLPVLTMPILDENSEAINSENDDVVALLHRTFDASIIVQLIEAAGLLRDRNDPESLIRTLDPGELPEWEARETGRIKRKLRALSGLFATGSPEVIIADGRREHPVVDALSGMGTVIRGEGQGIRSQ